MSAVQFATGSMRRRSASMPVTARIASASRAARFRSPWLSASVNFHWIAATRRAWRSPPTADAWLASGSAEIAALVCGMSQHTARIWSISLPERWMIPPGPYLQRKSGRQERAIGSALPLPSIFPVMGSRASESRFMRRGRWLATSRLNPEEAPPARGPGSHLSIFYWIIQKG